MMDGQFLLLGYALLLGALAVLWASHVADLRLLRQGVRPDDLGTTESRHSAQMASLERDVAAHGAYVDAVLKRRGVPKRERPDFVQHVLMSAVEAIRSGRYQEPNGSIKSYLAGIAHNVAGLFFRTKRRRPEELYDPQEEGDWECLKIPAPDVAAERSEVWSAVKEDLERDASSDVLVAHYLDEIPMGELARLLNVTKATVYKRREAALERLRRAARRRGGKY